MRNLSLIPTASARRIALGLCALLSTAALACDAPSSKDEAPRSVDEKTADAATPVEGEAAVRASGDNDKKDGSAVAAAADSDEASADKAAGHAAPQGVTASSPQSGPATGDAPDEEIPKILRVEGQLARPGFFRKEEQAEDAVASLFKHYGVGPTIATAETAVSTFAADVDTASYAVLRSHLEGGALPPAAAVRVEEVINYFDYHYAPPTAGDFSLHAEVVPSPQRRGYHVLHLGIKGKEVAAADRTAANLVFVIDVSGSMRGDRLNTVKKSLALLVGQLRSDDSVGIVAYGGSARVVLEPTNGSDKSTILQAIDTLKVQGSTNVEAGLTLGYDLIAKAKVGAGINRVILCSDGVANTGATTAETILGRVAKQAERGVTISTIGVGMGGYNDTLMEKLADKGNGNYAYVDDLQEAQRVFVDHLTGTLQVIAKDVKLQVEFDDAVVSRYRLLGYENRGLSERDFDDDTKDAGELGAGHTVTALYEIKVTDDEAESLGVLRVRYKKPRGTQSELVERPLPTSLLRASYEQAAPPTRLSMVAAAYAEKLRDSYWVRNLSWQQVESMYAQIDASLMTDPAVAELGRLIATASKLDQRKDRFEGDAPVVAMDFDRVPVLR